MPELLQLLEANLWMAIAALILLVLAIWWAFVATRKTKIERADQNEGTDQGAKRNQALIDTAPASQTPLAMAPAPALVPVPAPVPEASPERAPKVQTETAPPAIIPESETGAVSVPTAGTSAGDIGELKGVGAKLVAMLGDLGVTSIAQVAAWDSADIAKIDAQLGRFQGRISRDNWVLQAQLLQTGDIAVYEEKFGKR